MILGTQGLIVKSVKYSETSLILTIYTRELGMQSYLMRGVRASKSKARGNVLQPMNFLDLQVSKRENKNLQTIKEFRLDFVYERIPFEIGRTAMGMFMLELINATIKEEEANAELFDFLLSAYQFLDQVEALPLTFHLKFMLQLSGFLGFMPMLNFSQERPVFALEAGYFVELEESHPYVLDKPLSKLFHSLLSTSIPQLNQLKLTKAQRLELLSALEQYYKLHIVNFKEFKTPSIFGQVFG